MRAPAFLIAGFALAGCAGDAIRPAATAAMRLSQDLKSELAAFAARQNAEMQARRDAIAVLDENSAVSAFVANKQVLDWHSAKNEAALRTYEQATSLPIGTQLAGQATSKLFVPPKLAQRVAFDAKGYDALIKTLKPLTEKRSAIDDAKFLLQYGQSVTDAMEEDVAKATEDEQLTQVETGHEQ